MGLIKQNENRILGLRGYIVYEMSDCLWVKIRLFMSPTFDICIEATRRFYIPR